MKNNTAVDIKIPKAPEKMNSPYFLKNTSAVLQNEAKKENSDDVRKTSAQSNEPIANESCDEDILKQINALNSEFFKLVKRQFQIQLENANLQIEMLKIDWEYNSGFDEFISQFIGKKSAPLERKHSANEREYEMLEDRMKKIDKRVIELKAELKK